MAKVCVICGTQLRDDDVFCSVCGTEYRAQQEVDKGNTVAGPKLSGVCPVCGAPLEPGAAFCQVCGTRVSQDAPAPVPAHAPAPVRKKSPVPFVVAGVAVGLVVIAGAVFLLGGAGRTQSPTPVTPVTPVVDPGSGSSAKDDEDLKVIPADKDDDKNASDGSGESGGSPDGNSGGSSAADSEEPSGTSSSDADAPYDAPHDGYYNFILAESNIRVYSKSELEALTDERLELARNEIYARHGRGFNDKEIREYFETRDWYQKRYSPEEFDSMRSPLNSIELQNVANIQEIERSRK